MHSTWVAFGGFEEENPFRAAKATPQMYREAARHDTQSPPGVWQRGSETGAGSTADLL